MKMLSSWQMWKHRFLKEAGEGGAGGSGGGGSSGAGEGAGGAGDGAGVGDGSAGGDGKGAAGNGGAGGGAGGGEGAGGGGGAPALPEETQKELARLKKLEQASAAHLEVDPATGEYRPKAKAVESNLHVPTAEEIEQARWSNEVAEKSANLIEQNRAAEQKTMDKFKAEDPLFSSNFQKARDKVMALPPAQRTEVVWERAYSMAQGETMRTGAYAKHYKAEGKAEALAEYQKQGDMVLPEGTGAGAGGKGKKIDVSKITLSSEQRSYAVKMIQAGMLNSIDEYKENMVREGMIEEEVA